ncbi:MAG: hypothetical protein JXB19_03420 [Bacteroidales bacterium]|nr:hypothetical protein [Bacteroidales bacterium]
MLDKSKYIYSYRAFSLNILSQFSIAGFEPANFKEADVVIYEDDVPEKLPDTLNKGVLFEASAKGFLLKIDAVARYYAHDGREIIVNRTGNASDSEISAFLNGAILGALLHQRRMLPLHASTVIYHDKGLLFAGMSGSGKSTLAAALVHDEATLVADDISVIDFTGSSPGVLPAFPSIKLWEDSLKHLNISFEMLQPVRDELKKFYLPVEQFSRKPVKIDHLFILTSHNRFDFEVKKLQGVDKFRVLKKHTYLFRGIPKTGLEQNHFRLVNQLAEQVPVTLLTRPNAEFDTRKLIDAITDHISRDQNE